MWTFNTLLVSNTDQQVLIWVKSNEDSMVWTATTLAYEVVASNWEHLQLEKRPLSQWESIFDPLHASDGLTQNIPLAMQAATNAATDICEKGGISPLKRAHSQLSLPTAQGMKGDNILYQFRDSYSDAIKEHGLALDVQQSHMAVLNDLNKRIKVQELYKTEENMALQDQNMVGVQNRLVHRNPNEASLTITEQLLVVKDLETKTQHLTDVMLACDECKMVEYIFKQYGSKLSSLRQQIIKSAFEQIVPFITLLKRFYGMFTCQTPGAVPGDILDAQLQHLEDDD